MRKFSTWLQDLKDDGIASKAKTVGIVALSLAVIAGSLATVFGNVHQDKSGDALSSQTVVRETAELPKTDEVVVQSVQQKKKISFWSMASYLLGCAGSFLVKLIGSVASPILSHVLSGALLLAGVCGALVLALKIAFPNLPLKELLKGKRKYLVLVVAIALIGIYEYLDYRYKGLAFRLKIGCYVLGAVLLILAFRRISKKIEEEKNVIKLDYSAT